MRSLNLRNFMKLPGAPLVKRGMLGAFPALAILCVLVLTWLLIVPPASAKDIQQLPHEPNNPKRHQVYYNTTDKHEYIYNGEEWVPHDASIDTYVLKKYKKSKVPKNPSDDNGAGKKKDSSDKQGVAK